MKNEITIAIDGYSSCGKSTMAKALAKALRFTFIDSGAMYRGVTLYCMQHNLIKDGQLDAEKIIKTLPAIDLYFKFNSQTEQSDLYLNGINVEKLIRLPDVAGNVSKIASIKAVREKLVSEQRKLGRNGGIVMDGRDIGSVVFPDAELKIFVTASPEIRAERRLKELVNNGVIIKFEDVLRNITERDEMDSNREESPLLKTKDAHVIDTSNLTPDEQLNFALKLVEKTLLNR